MNRSRRRVRVAWLRFLRFLGKTFKTSEELTQEQKTAIKIFERSVSYKDAEIFFSPLSEGIYVEVKDVYLILDHTDLQVINGKFQYEVELPERVKSGLRSRVYNILESRRSDIEKKIKIKSDNTLISILDTVDEIRKTPAD